MNQQLDKILELLRGTGGGAKAIAVMVALALVGIIGVGTLMSQDPDYGVAFSNLQGHEMGNVTKALAEAGIPFEVSNPPGPFVVFVDEADRTRAYQAAYGAGALSKPLRGILSEGGMSSVFSSAEERNQGVRKREWEEMEKMLEALDFVSSASVRTSPGASSPIAARNAPPVTASVTLRVAGTGKLSDEQAQTVANLVGRGLGVQAEDLVISDHTGASIFDGSALEEGETSVRDFLAQQREHDEEMTNRANAVLSEILGPKKARVTVNSQWDYAQTASRTQTPVGTGSVVSELKSKSERPVGNANESVVGVTANSLDSSTVPASAGEPAMETTSEERKEFVPTISAEETVRVLPKLERLSIALFLDSSIEAARRTDLEEAVKASVGYVETRDDFRSAVLPFAVPEPVEEPVGEAAEVAEPAKPSPLMELLLRRGVEIASALVFLVVLLKSLKSSKSAQAETAEEPAAAEEVDPEALAQAKVLELLEEDPDEVSQILTRWATEEETVGAE